jgi:hypothetical protein
MPMVERAEDSAALLRDFLVDINDTGHTCRTRETGDTDGEGVTRLPGPPLVDSPVASVFRAPGAQPSLAVERTADDGAAEWLTVTLRGLASSATGMVSVSTPSR